jgi:hypothetical protein
MRKDLDRAFTKMRDDLADRLDDVDVDSLRKQLRQISDVIADRFERGYGRVQDRVRPQRRPNRLPVALMVLIGSIAGMAFLFYDSRRREMMRERMMQLQGEAKRQLPDMRNKASQAVGSMRARGMGSNGGAEQARLKTEVEAAIKGGQADLPAELEVEVEGRTVYLRGSTSDRAMLDQAVDRAQSVEGVSAVINLVSVVPTGSR